MIVHRDRDYLSDDDVDAFKQALDAHDISVFVTDGSDVESYFVNPAYLNQCNPAVSSARIGELIEVARNMTKATSIEAIVNLRTQEAFRKRNQGGAGPNHGQIAVAAATDYDGNPALMMRGKVVLNRIKALIQQEQGTNAVVLMTSPHLTVQALRNIVNPPAPAPGAPAIAN